MCLWPGYHLHHDTAKHGYSGVVKKSTGKWNGALLRVGSVCMRVMDVQVFGVDLMSVIFGNDFPTTRRIPSGFMVHATLHR